MAEKDKNANRRTVLKSIGAGATATSLPALAGEGAATGLDESDVTITQYEGRTAKKLIGTAIRSDDTRTVLRKVRKHRFTPQIGNAVAKGYERADGYRQDGVIIPLEPTKGHEELWTSLDSADSIEATTGFVVWESNNATAKAFIFGVDRSGVRAADLLQDDTTTSIDMRSDGNVHAAKLITPTETELTEIGQETANDKISPADHSVEHCVGENTGIIEIGDDVFSCGLCLTPGNGFGILDLVECLWCIYELESTACIIGYCQDKEGGSTGDAFCSVADTVASTPLWLLPISNAGLQLTAAAISYGCSSNEATDCTSPIID